MPVQSNNDYFLIVYLDLVIYLKATLTTSALFRDLVIYLKATLTTSALFPAHKLDAIIIVITYY